MNESRYAAAPSDGQEILRILESSAAQGSIELLYTRRPDAYASYMQEPGEARVFVSKDGGRTVGTCAELISDVYIGGEIRKAAYICGLKKDADYEGGVGFGVHLLRDFCREDIDFYYCSVVADNADALRMFEKSRRIISMTPMATYRTYIVSPRARIKAPRHSYIFRQAAEGDLPSLLDFLHREGRKKDLFPVIPSLDRFHGLTVKDFYLLLDGNRIIAAAALWNRTSCKQYVVKQYRGLLKLARWANPLLCALRYIRLPKENIPLDFPMLSFALAEQDRTDTYGILMNELRKEVARSYGIYVIGLPVAHPAARIFDRVPSIRFDTKLYEIRLPWGKGDGAAVDPRRLHPECGLL